MIAEVCAFNGVEHIVRVVGFEGESVAARRTKVVDGVFKSAGFADDGYRAVTQRNHLGKAAGLTFAGHEQHVRARINSTGKGRHKAGNHAHPAGVARSKTAEKFLVLRFAAAQNHHLRVHVHNTVAHVFNKVYALVRNKPPDHSDKHGAGVNAKPDFFLEGGFVSRFAGKVVGAEVRSDVRVGFRVVAFAVDAVQNAGELVAAFPQKSVKPPGVPWVKNFLRVGGAYGGDHIAAVDSALHIVAAPAEFNKTALVLRQTGDVAGDEHIKIALILNIMYGEHGFYSTEFRITVIKHLKEHRNKSGLPVVAVKNVRGEVTHVANALEYRHRKECEAFAVVVVAIYAAAAEIIFVVDEIVDDAVLFCGEQSAVELAPGKADGEALEEGHFLAQVLWNVGIERQNDAAVCACGTESLWQRTGNIGKPAAGDIGSCLACCKKYVHGVPPFYIIRQI